MKKIVIIIHILLVALFQAQSLTSTENYIYSRTYLEPVVTEQPNAAQVQGVQYFDGLGRPIQSIAIKASPSGKDLAVPAVYDQWGRKTKEFLPQPVDSQNGAFIQNIGENSVNAYYGIPNAYSEIQLEKSPLARVEKKAAPGTDWQITGSHTQKMEYLSNSANEVKRYKAVTTWNPATQINDVSFTVMPDDAYTTNGYFNSNTLYKISSKDEDNHETQTFVNSRKQTILMRQINSKENGTTENLDTYYVYDEYGNLSLIIPPKAAVSPLSSALIEQLCFQYKYDKYNRQIEKKLPGKGWEYVIYDQQNRLVASQDANLRAKGQWLYTKYDPFGRVAITGISTGSTRIAEQNMASASGLNNVKKVSSVQFSRQGMDVYYDSQDATYPNSSKWVSLLSLNYYDAYPAGSPAQPTQILTQPTLSPEPATIISNGWSSIRSTKTMPTASYTKNIENDSWSSAFIWYDTLGRVIGTYGKNHLDGFTRTESLLDFSGKTKEVYTYHSKNTTAAQVTVKDRFLYSPQSFLVKHYQQINTNNEELIADYTYNDLGQVNNKKVGNNLQSIDYTYNIRGWLTGINPNEMSNLGSKLFSYKLKYTQREGAETPNNEYSDLKVTPRYNGSIAEADWKTATDQIQRRYGYSYDGTNRLKAGFYQNDTNPYLKEYNEILNYDLNGNITTLQRTAAAIDGISQVIDDLSYVYNGNMLTNVTDSSQNYGGYPSASGTLIDYDGNGNMTSQQDKGILNIVYNHLNLPSSIIYNTTYIIQDPFVGQVERNVNTQYIYRADGKKLKMQYTYYVGKSHTEIKKTTEYLENFQYENNVLQFLANEEGYYDFVQNRYIYNYKDHLGNIRLSYYRQTDGTAKVLEENHYYPFGLRHTGYTPLANNNTFRYKYNGKELQENGMLDYGWRNYMPELGRWNAMDQLSEKYHYASPYAYVMNNPINMYDPDGRDKMPAWLQSMWDATPVGTNSSWSNQGDHFVATEFWGSQSGYYHSIVGSTVSMGGGSGGGGGSSGSGGGTVSMGDGAFSYMYNGERIIYLPELILKGLRSSWANQFQSHFDKFWNTTQTNTHAEVRSLIPANPFIKAENTMYHTKGNAGTSNIDYRVVRNSNTGSLNGLISYQLNLSSLNLYNELTTGSDTNGFMISIGNYSLGGSGTLSFDLINSDISLNLGQKLDNNNSSVNSYGIKPLTAAMVIAGFLLERFTPPTVVPVTPSGGIIDNNLIL